MIRKISLSNFTTFQNASIEFCKGINVLIGKNGTGKTHLMKVGYAALKSEVNFHLENGGEARFLEDLSHAFFAKKDLSKGYTRLCSRVQGATHTKVEVELYNNATWTADFTSKKTDNPKSARTGKVFKDYNHQAPIFIPAKEILSIAKGLAALYEAGQLRIDGTIADLETRLGPDLILGRPENTELSSLKADLQKVIGGAIKRDANGTYYVAAPRKANFEIDLVAEGHRKLACLGFLLGNGMLKQGATIFWDEPDANLNPELIRLVVPILFKMAEAGFQIVLATHSLFLLKEINGYYENNKSTSGELLFTSLTAFSGNSMIVEQNEDLLELEHIATLDAEIAQIEAY